MSKILISIRDKELHASSERVFREILFRLEKLYAENCVQGKLPKN